MLEETAQSQKWGRFFHLIENKRKESCQTARHTYKGRDKQSQQQEVTHAS